MHDVVITNPIASQVLTYNGSYWVNANASSGGATELNDLTDVTITSASNTEILVYNSTSGQWEDETHTDNNSCTSTGTGEAVCESANNINSLIGDSGITITDTTGDLTLTPKYELLCIDTASSGDTNLQCSSLPNRNTYFVTIQARVQTGNAFFDIRFNGDTGSNYAFYYQNNYGGGTGAVVTSTNQASISLNSLDNGDVGIIECVIQNQNSATRKQGSCTSVYNADTADTSLPDRRDIHFKWDNTSNAIDTINWFRSANSGTILEGQMVVWGYD